MRGEIRISEIVHRLGEQNLLPAIVFRTARSQCDLDAEYAAGNEKLLLPASVQAEIERTADEIMTRYDMERELILTHPHYRGLITTGIAAHHAGQLLMWRLLLEELMGAGALRVLVATGTVAAGVDFPARSVVITAHSKRGAEGFSNLTPTEFQQMSGRAGRRGKDTVGFCIAAPAPFCDARAVLRIAQRPPEPLASAYFPSPSTVLNLLRYRNVDELRFTVERSLAAFYDRREAEKLLIEAEDLRDTLPENVRKALSVTPGQVEKDDDEHLPAEAVSRDLKKKAKRVRRFRRMANDLKERQVRLLETALNGLTTLGYVEGTTLSQKGYWAANLCTNIALELGEIIEGGMFDNPSSERLATIIASISGDEHRKYLDTKSAVVAKDDQGKLQEIIDRVAATGMPGVSSERNVSLSAAYTVLAWMHSDDWHGFRSLLLLSGVAEGDAARLITQTAEQLNQISRLQESHPLLAARAEEAKLRILRPPLTEVINLETV